MSERNSTIFKSNGSSAGGGGGIPSVAGIVEKSSSKSREGSIIIRNNTNNNNNSGMNNQNESVTANKKLGNDSNLLQISIPPYQQVQQYQKKCHKTLLPTNVTIPVGLAQVFIGSSMVICGSLAFRYRSYLFYYGTGLWAGALTGLTGALAIMCTKKGLPMIRSLCGGRKWQLQVFVGFTMLALTSSVLLSIFSTSGLMQDTQYTTEGREIDSTDDDELFEKRKSTGVAINALLLLLAMLEILLAFCSLGIVLRVLCSTRDPSSSLVSSDSMISQMTVRDILGAGAGPEYEARKDRLFRWLTHQGRNLFINSSSSSSSPRNLNSKSTALVPFQNQNNYMVPHLIAIQPPSSTLSSHHNTFIPNAPTSRRILYQQPQLLIPHIEQPRAYYPAHMPMQRPIFIQPGQNLIPICPIGPPPPRMVKTPFYEYGTGRRSEAGGGPAGRRRRKIGSMHGSMSNSGSFKSSSTAKRKALNNVNNLNNTKNNAGSCKSNSTRSKKKLSKEQKLTEEEIGKTYTGLDQAMAEDFISTSMDKY